MLRQLHLEGKPLTPAMAMLHLLQLTRLTSLHLRSTKAAGSAVGQHCQMSFSEGVGSAQVCEGGYNNAAMCIDLTHNAACRLYIS